MTLHRRVDEEPDIDPDDCAETARYVSAAVIRWRWPCTTCGAYHRTEKCP